MSDASFTICRILLIRWKQFYRLLFQLGLVRLAILLSIFLFLFAAVYTISSQEQKAYFITLGWLIIVAFIDTKRKDTFFLHLISSQPSRICLFEYFLISLPVIICLTIHKQWCPFAIVLLGITCIGFVNLNWKRQHKTLNTRLQQWIPFDMYEWKSGVRKYFYLIIIVWLIGVCLSFFVASIPVAVFVIGLLFLEWFDTNESWQILLSFEKGALQLLLHKISRHFLIFSILVVPLIVIFMVFHFHLWYIPVIEFILFLSIQIYCLLVKYAFYSHEESTSGSRPFMVVGILVGLIPPCIPLLWLLSIYFFRKAQINLNFYLNDYN